MKQNIQKASVFQYILGRRPLLGTEVFPSFAIHDPMPAWVGDLKSPEFEVLYLCKHKDGGHRVKQAQKSQEWENEGYLYNQLHILHMFILMFDSFCCL